MFLSLHFQSLVLVLESVLNPWVYVGKGTMEQRATVFMGETPWHGQNHELGTSRRLVIYRCLAESINALLRSDKLRCRSYGELPNAGALPLVTDGCRFWTHHVDRL